MLREIVEAKGKWHFLKSNPGMSGTTTIEAEINGLLITIGWVETDRVWYSSIGMEDDGFARKYDGTNGWEDLMGPQGDYSAVDYDSEKLGDVINNIEKTFKVKVDKKAIQQMVDYVLGIQ